MMLEVIIMFASIITFVCWVLSLANWIESSRISDKDKARVSLCLIFWPIGFLVLMFNLFKIAFSKEEKN